MELPPSRASIQEFQNKTTSLKFLINMKKISSWNYDYRLHQFLFHLKKSRVAAMEEFDTTDCLNGESMKEFKLDFLKDNFS